MKTLLTSLLAALTGALAPQQTGAGGPLLDPVGTRAAAMAALESGRAEEASELLTALARQDPADAESRRLLGHARFAEGRAGEARAAFVEAVGLGRVTPAMLVTLARIDLEAGRRDGAESALARLAWFQPYDRDALLLRAQNLAALGRHDEARALVEELTGWAPQDPRAWRLAGSFALERDATGEAARALERAWWLGSREPELAEGLAGLALGRGRPDRARRWLERAAERDPSGDDRRADVWRGLARLELEVGRPKAAIALLGDRFGDGGSALDAELLGHALAADGRPQEAVEAWRRAVATGCEDRGVLAHLVSVALERDDRPLLVEALAALERVADAADAETTRLRCLGHLRLGDPDRARSAVRARVARIGLDDRAGELLALLVARPTATVGPGQDH